MSLVMHLEDGDVLSLRKGNTIYRLSPNTGAYKRIPFCISTLTPPCPKVLFTYYLW